MTTLYDAQAKDKIAHLIKDIKSTLMATFDRTGQIFHARPMMAVSDGFEDATLWFFTAANSHKVDEINANHNALLTYADPNSQNYVSLSGHAHVLRNQALIDKFWTDSAKIWFPKGKDDPNLVLIRFDAVEAEFWDGSSNPLTRGYGALKAIFTGKPGEVAEDLSETSRVKFRADDPAIPADINYERAAAASSDITTTEPATRDLLGVEPELR